MTKNDTKLHLVEARKFIYINDLFIFTTIAAILIYLSFLSMKFSRFRPAKGKQNIWKKNNSGHIDIKLFECQKILAF